MFTSWLFLIKAVISSKGKVKGKKIYSVPWEMFKYPTKISELKWSSLFRVHTLGNFISHRHFSGKLQKFKIIYCSSNKNVIPSQYINRKHNIFFHRIFYKNFNMTICVSQRPSLKILFLLSRRKDFRNKFSVFVINLADHFHAIKWKTSCSSS
jgi:hypothetical protein